MELDRIPPAIDRTTWRVVVETPRGSRIKYVFDPALGAITVDKFLPEGMVFPFDFGFIPQTKGEDGDPLDALVLAEEPFAIGCVVDCRLIGVLEATQVEPDGTRGRNDRYLAVPLCSRQFQSIVTWRDLPAPVLDGTREFFVNYCRLLGKTFKPLRLRDAAAAAKSIERQRTESKSGANK